MNNEILSIETLEEIVRLKKENKELRETLDNVIQDASEYQKRIDKAIRYIKENEKEYGSLEENEKIILDILKGSD